MAKTLLIFVGGTGLHSFLAYFRLMKVLNSYSGDCFLPEGLDRRGQAPFGKFLLIDGDVKTQKKEGDKKTLYGEFRELNLKGSCLMDPYPRNFSGKANNINFFTLCGGEDILKYLFEKEHRDLIIYEGFIGSPPVGATSFYMKLKDMEKPTSGGNGNDIEGAFINSIEGASIDRVIFAGSVFGGTGAGVIPALAEYIKRVSSSTQIIYIAHLKWFTLSKNEKSNVTDGRLNENLVGGIKFLQNKQNVFDKVVFLDYTKPVGRENEGGSAQSEHRDFLYLLTAFLMFGFERLKLNNLVNGLYAINLNVNEGRSIYEKFAIREEYDAEKDFFLDLTGDRDAWSLYNYLGKFYLYYLFLRYMEEYVDITLGTGADPLRDDVAKILTSRKEELKNLLSEEVRKVEEILRFFVDISGGNGNNISEDIKNVSKLPYDESDVGFSKTPLEKLEEINITSEKILEFMRQLKVSEESLESFLESIWKNI